MATRRVGARGRSKIALALLGFVLIAAGVIWRRGSGIAYAKELRSLQQHGEQLAAQRTRLEADIRDASSRARLAPIAERRLNMHVPDDSQVVIITRSPATH